MKAALFGLRVASGLLVLVSVGWFYSRDSRGLEQPTVAAEADSEEELRKLLTARYDTAARLLQIEEQRLAQGVTTLSRVCEAARWVRDSAVELPVSAGERLKALSSYVELTQRLEENVTRAVDNGAAPPVDKEWARYLRLDAEVTLVRTRSGQGLPLSPRPGR